jgi:hypothetical protein
MSFKVTYYEGRKRRSKTFPDGFILNVHEGALSVIDSTVENPEVVEILSAHTEWHAEKA